MIRTIEQIGHDIRTQDNRITELPIFVVQQKRRVYGLNPEWTDDIVWLDQENCFEASGEDLAAIEELLSNGKEPPSRWARTGYVDIWEFVTCCFTENGCNDYIAENMHNLKEPRVYVCSGYCNREWETVLDHLAGRATR